MTKKAPLHAPLSVGELIDRLTILEIKAQRISSPLKRRAVCRERDALAVIAAPYLSDNGALKHLKQRLTVINRTLWACEHASRLRFRTRPNAAASSALLTRTARLNDLRHRNKQRISRAASSAFIEHKSYFGS